MSRRPRAVKFSLAVRKNIWDGWENKKGELEQRLSDILGQPWTISADPWALYPYAEEYSWAQQSLGDAIFSLVSRDLSNPTFYLLTLITLLRYVESASDQIWLFLTQHGDEVQAEINEICSAHVLTLDYDDTNTVDYCGVRVSPEGKLMIVFNEHRFGTNASVAAESNNLTKALNDAPSPKPMSFIVRSSIRRDYDPRIKEIQEKLNKIVKQELSLIPNFEANFVKLKGNAGDNLDWQSNFGNIQLSYFDALVSQLEHYKFGEDAMLQEGLLEIRPKNAVHIRVVDQIKRTYSEVIAEDGILYLQTTPNHFGVNTSEVATDIVNIL
ncbi:uncharacterized protein FIESC28_07995 [Fusarium coffeatum]|uniref:Uncharacterized protein n=1 Tax=Fusarium coffeatum TaxID=231269 RepID=A0A366RA57_9HYPO|nr:uncharacterized protein FIESC28_07995 [Fusarium coffeatum]RBR14029.1 hypothetical protein FIESC28_07995 [Fusarium coffeatum]